MYYHALPCLTPRKRIILIFPFLQARLFQEEGFLVMKAIKPIHQGEEIFNDYGQIPRSDLLRRYGYVTENYAPYDVVELPLDVICSVAGLASADPDSQPQVR